MKYVLYVRGPHPPNYIPTRGCLRSSIFRCGAFYMMWNADKKLSAQEAPERPTPPPAHVICGGGKTLGRVLYVPPQNLGLMRSIFSAVAKSKLIEED